MPDFTQDVSPELTNYLSVGICFVILIIIGRFGMYLNHRIVLDMFEEAENNTDFKLFLGNILKQAGVVSALLLSIEIPMLQLELIPSNTILWNVYYGLCFISTGFSIQGVFVSVMA